MKKVALPYFYVENAFGGSQKWLRSAMMRLGGCAAVTACDLCIFLKKYNDKNSLYPHGVHSLSKEDYVAFTEIMKPYLHPRISGIDKLDIYVEGLMHYMADQGEKSIHLEGVDGNISVQAAEDIVRAQMDKGFPIPMLMLKHYNKIFSDYVWHWFMLTGYEQKADKFLVKATTYGRSEWLDFNLLWDTRFERKGGLIIVREQ